jgi:hypothetical protein
LWRIRCETTSLFDSLPAPLFASGSCLAIRPSRTVRDRGPERNSCTRGATRERVLLWTGVKRRAVTRKGCLAIDAPSNAAGHGSVQRPGNPVRSTIGP